MSTSCRRTNKNKRVNDDSGFQTFCVSCGEMVAWSTVTYERKVEGPVTKLSETDKELLR